MTHHRTNNVPEPRDADDVDRASISPVALYAYDPAASNPERRMVPVTLEQLRGMPGSGPLLGQASGTIDATSRALPGIPAGTVYARLQLRGAGVSVRYDGPPATGAELEEKYAAGGILELFGTEVAGFRYISTGGVGTYSVVYRGG